MLLEAGADVQVGSNGRSAFELMLGFFAGNKENLWYFRDNPEEREQLEIIKMMLIAYHKPLENTVTLEKRSDLSFQADHLLGFFGLNLFTLKSVLEKSNKSEFEYNEKLLSFLKELKIPTVITSLIAGYQGYPKVSFNLRERFFEEAEEFIKHSPSYPILP